MENVLSFAKSVLIKESEAIKECISCINDKFYNAVEEILGCKGKVLLTGVGKSGNIAAKISSTLSSTGTPSVFVHPTDANHGDLGIITKQDLIIACSNSGETFELFNLIEYANRFSIKLISIVSNPVSSLAVASNIAIIMPKLEEACPNKIAPTTTTAATLAIGDALALSVCLKRQFSIENFKNIHPGGNIGRRLLKVCDIMKTSEKHIPVCNYMDKIDKVINAISQKKEGCVAVLNDNLKLVGIITDGDLRRAYSPNLFNLCANDIMSRSPIVTTADDLAVNALKCMNQELISNLLVIDSQEARHVVGILHIHDCLKSGLA